MLGYLLSDGNITYMQYRGKGDETHMQFICKYDDREVMYKLKNVLHTSANVHEYPNYKSPQAKLCPYDRIDIINEYSNIKKQIPEDKIKGYERHFIRGLIDGDGTLSCRKDRNTFRLGFVNQVENITQWVTKTICEKLNLPSKNPRWSKQNNLWEVLWEGNIARLIAWWLYHGNVQHCSLQRKLDKYKSVILQNQSYNNYDDELIKAVNAFYDENNEIAFVTPGNQTLDWCKRLQKLLTFNAVPVFHNKGKRKYYHLYIPVVNTQNLDLKNQVKA